MSLLAKLYIGDNKSGVYLNEYRVVDFQLRSGRNANEYCPDSEAFNDRLRIALIAPDKYNLELYEWYVTQSLLSGKLVIDISNQSVNYEQVQRTILFEMGQCFSLSEKYDISATYRHLLILEIVLHKMTVDDVTFKTVHQD